MDSYTHTKKMWAKKRRGKKIDWLHWLSARSLFEIRKSTQIEQSEKVINLHRAQQRSHTFINSYSPCPFMFFFISCPFFGMNFSFRCMRVISIRSLSHMERNDQKHIEYTHRVVLIWTKCLLPVRYECPHIVYAYSRDFYFLHRCLPYAIWLCFPIRFLVRLYRRLSTFRLDWVYFNADVSKLDYTVHVIFASGW